MGVNTRGRQPRGGKAWLGQVGAWHRVVYAQLSISSVQFCWSRGYLRRSIMQAAVVVILKEGEKNRIYIYYYYYYFTKKKIKKEK